MTTKTKTQTKTQNNIDTLTNEGVILPKYFIGKNKVFTNNLYVHLKDGSCLCINKDTLNKFLQPSLNIDLIPYINDVDGIIITKVNNIIISLKDDNIIIHFIHKGKVCKTKKLILTLNYDEVKIFFDNPLILNNPYI